MTSETALIVEDDASLRALLTREMEELGLLVESVPSGERALAVLAARVPTLVLSDLRLPGIDGIALLDRIRELAIPAPPPTIIMTAFGTVDRAVDALKHGAVDFLTKPLDLDHLRLRVQRLLDVEQLRRRVSKLRQGAIDTPFHGMVGQSPAMLRLIAEVRQIAAGRAPVLIVGDSGVGKELVARAIHRESERQDGPFVPVNCASIHENLLESEFFGHERGSFTGAHRSSDGLFGAARGGTIFLDEVGELPVALQAKLLRVLQEGAVRPVGATREVELDVRVLAATNRDMDGDIAMGRFRKDLYYRLETFLLEVPPLAARDGDVEVLAAHLLDKCSRPLGKRIEGLAPNALTCLQRYAFPGNVRELENIIEHAVTFCTGSMIEVEHLPQRLRSDNTTSTRPTQALPPALLVDGTIPTLSEVSTRYVRHVLEATDNNKRRAARLLGISRQTLYRYLKEEDCRQEDGS